MATSSDACHTASPQSTFRCGFAHCQGQAAPCLPVAPPPRKFHLVWGWEGCLLYFSSQDLAKRGELGSRELSVSDVFPEASPLYPECKAGVSRVGYLEEVAFLYPLITSASGERPSSLETLGLTQVVKRESRLGGSQLWLIGVPGNECGPASAPPAEPDMLNGSGRLASS